MISGNSGWTKLNESARTFVEKWAATEAGWRDQKRVQFEQDCIEPIEASVDSALRAMKDLSDILARLHRDCRDEADS